MFMAGVAMFVVQAARLRDLGSFACSICCFMQRTFVSGIVLAQAPHLPDSKASADNQQTREHANQWSRPFLEGPRP
jgi:hypothetical protein